MGRPRAARGSSGAENKSSRTRARILVAAAQLLDRHGYAGTRLTEIAELASVQAPALYYYFPSRDALVEQVVLSGQATIIDHVVGVLSELPDDLPPIERVREAVAAHLRIVLETSDFSSAALRNASQLPEPIRAKLVEGQRTYSDIWRGLVVACAEAGQLAPDLDVGLARMFVLGALNWAPQWFDPDRGPVDDVIDTTQRFILHALTRGVPDDLRDAVAAQAPAGLEAR
ncbi:TetR/AcrR family transcriptional regulator [Actinomycetospora endophytica]|uniref:TetR/AcrR family transcriptional regulator n=1 Tax=Actinomycetospora endophytica TaxID=2291215 RepID=A0ABS8P8K0_9PSEU|nr:TetR/AcrR family transcriptional regulator [Actinomycetospora endophytica]MCD2194595.1 TetR/AcrR family transcriptional regulator [Actinomycetospora endophytica]